MARAKNIYVCSKCHKENESISVGGRNIKCKFCGFSIITGKEHAKFWNPKIEADREKRKERYNKNKKTKKTTTETKTENVDSKPAEKKLEDNQNDSDEWKLF